MEAGHLALWEKSITATDLTVVPAKVGRVGQILRPAAIMGRYGHHDVVLDVFARFEQDFGSGKTVERMYTRLSVIVSYDPEIAIQLNQTRAKLQAVQDLFKILTTDQSVLFKGKLSISSDAQQLSYIRTGFEIDILPLLDAATQLADNFVWIWYLGGEVVPLLRELILKADPELSQMGMQLLRAIAKDTKVHWGSDPKKYTCSTCLTQCEKYFITDVSIIPITYYGCRTCGQSREFLEQMVVVELNEQMPILQEERQGILHINWLQRQTLFDFEGVFIVKATDETVERFAIQVGNDTDPIRRPYYKKMRCIVLKQCDLMENTLRILRRTFGEVILQ